MKDEQIKYMVDRFLGWRLPENFNPDGGISFKKMANEKSPWPRKNEPVGTNLLDADQAEQMVRYMVEGLPGEKIMQPHQQRVVEEKAELSDKLDKLETFHDGSIYAGLPPAEQSRLTRQLCIMKLYEQVLSERISAF